MTKQRVVGFLGAKNAGKDTAAKALIAQGWQRVAFADALYKEVAEAYGVTVEFLQGRNTKETPLPELALTNCADDNFVDIMMSISYDKCFDENQDTLAQFKTLVYEAEKPRSPREVLQYWGTEYRRQTCGDDYWRKQVAQFIESQPECNFVVTDVRYADEAFLVTEHFSGQLARVSRPAQPRADDQHSSEQALRDYHVDFQFVNHEGPSGKRQLQEAVHQVFHHLYKS